MTKTAEKPYPLGPHCHTPTLSFFSFVTFSLFAELSDERPVAEGRVLWDGVEWVAGVGGRMPSDD